MHAAKVMQKVTNLIVNYNVLIRTGLMTVVRKRREAYTFIDLFSGCGGLSLGLMNAGWKGLFAVEKSPDAFQTIKHNLIDESTHNSSPPKFNWPTSIDISPCDIGEFIKTNEKKLKSMRGKVDLVAGGPPCQGFSFAGKRNSRDPRNKLFKFHLDIVGLIQPNLVLMENVKGIEIAFGNKANSKSYAHRICNELQSCGYVVQQHIIKAVDYGVPQLRPRYFTLGIRQDLINENSSYDMGKLLSRIRCSFLEKKGLSTKFPVSAKQAISDLEISGNKLIDCVDEQSRNGFKQILYKSPRTEYQKLMHGKMNGCTPNSLRLPNHRHATVERFETILRECRKGVHLSNDDRNWLGIKKTSITPLAPDKPSFTITTIPDDLIHYSEPRVHTVREYARFQSFPDWFEFKGKYTTGGDRRKIECPRYTQVGNAVPPLLAEAIGEALLMLTSKMDIMPPK